MKLDDFLVREALCERNYLKIIELICEHFRICVPDNCIIKDECRNDAIPTRAVIVMPANKRTYGYASARQEKNDEAGCFVSWDWEYAAQVSDIRETYLLVTG